MSTTLLWIRRGAFTLAALVAALVLLWLVILYWAHHAATANLPQVDGAIHLSGLTAPVHVRRDGHGVPHIDAATQDDMLFAQGYITAQDRLFQMDALRRNSSGELAEILGPSMVEHDKLQRVYQFRSIAERIYANLTEADRHRFEVYASGVNLYIQQNLDNLPVEFRLLRLLLSRPGHIFVRSRLLDSVHEDLRDVSDRAIDSHIKNLRRKLDQAGVADVGISSVYGVGYRFTSLD